MLCMEVSMYELHVDLNEIWGWHEQAAWMLVFAKGAMAYGMVSCCNGACEGKTLLHESRRAECHARGADALPFQVLGVGLLPGWAYLLPSSMGQAV